MLAGANYSREFEKRPSRGRKTDCEYVREEVEAVAVKRVLTRQLEQAIEEQQKTKQAMAKQLHTSRSQLDRLLDSRNVSVTPDTITRRRGRSVSA